MTDEGDFLTNEEEVSTVTTSARTVQKLLGHTDVNTAMNYTHVLHRGGRGVRSPVDGLAISVPPGQPQRNYADQP